MGTDASAAGPTPQDLVVSALKAIASGIGVVGSVAVFGAAILWLRFFALHLPASYAVSVVPKGELIAVGASFVAPTAGIALAAAAILVILKRLLARYPNLLGSLSKRLGKLLQIEEYIEVLEQLSAAEAMLRRAQRERDAAREELRFEANDENAEADQRATAEFRQALQTRNGAQARAKKLGRLQAAVTPALMLLATATATAVYTVEDGWPVLPTLAVGTLVATGIAYFALTKTTSILWSVLGVVAAAAVYAGFLQGARTYHSPKIEAIALTRTQKAPPVVGGLVADTGDEVYVVIKTSGGKWAVRRVPRAKILGEVVGGLTRRSKLLAAARSLLSTGSG